MQSLAMAHFLRWVRPAFAALLCLVLLGRPVLAEGRVAVVVGNAAYTGAPLDNPANDARLIAQTLTELGFDTSLYLELTSAQMPLLLDRISETMATADAGLFYYAGHGVQLKGQNYLIPIGVDIRQEFEIPDEGVDADAVLRAMESAGNGLNIVILDACRNNPFTRGFGSAGRGLARMDGPAGTFIAYATAPGAISQDGRDGRNSPYTRYLIAVSTASTPVFIINTLS